MNDKIVYLEDYKKLLELQQKYEDGIITEKDMTVEELEALNNLYLKQIKELENTLTKKLVQKSGEW